MVVTVNKWSKKVRKCKIRTRTITTFVLVDCFVPVDFRIHRVITAGLRPARIAYPQLLSRGLQIPEDKEKRNEQDSARITYPLVTCLGDCKSPRTLKRERPTNSRTPIFDLNISELPLNKKETGNTLETRGLTYSYTFLTKPKRSTYGRFDLCEERSSWVQRYKTNSFLPNGVIYFFQVYCDIHFYRDTNYSVRSLQRTESCLPFHIHICS